jgi:hypothetical protein
MGNLSILMGNLSILMGNLSILMGNLSILMGNLSILMGNGWTISMSFKPDVSIVVFLRVAASPIAEASPTKENQDSIAEMCAQLSQGLSALSDDDPFHRGQGQVVVNHGIGPTPGATPQSKSNKIWL